MEKVFTKKLGFLPYQENQVLILDKVEVSKSGEIKETMLRKVKSFETLTNDQGQMTAIAVIFNYTTLLIPFSL